MSEIIGKISAASAGDVCQFRKVICRVARHMFKINYLPTKQNLKTVGLLSNQVILII